MKQGADFGIAVPLGPHFVLGSGEIVRGKRVVIYNNGGSLISGFKIVITDIDLTTISGIFEYVIVK